MPSLLMPLERSRLKTLSRSVTPGNTKLPIFNELHKSNESNNHRQ